MQDPQSEAENKNAADPMEAWGSIKIKDTRVARAKAEENKFSIGLWAGLWCAFCMLATGLMAVAGYHTNPFGAPQASYRLGGVIGSGLAVLIMSYIAGWFFWRISGRNRLLGKIIFCLMAGFALLSQFSQYMAVTKARKSMEEVTFAVNEIARYEGKYQNEYPKSQLEVPGFVNKILEGFDVKAAAVDSRDTVQTDIFIQIRKIAVHRLQSEAEFGVALQRVQAHLENKTDYFRDSKNVEATINDAERLVSAGDTYRKDQESMPAYVGLTLREKKLPARFVDGFVAGVQSSNDSLSFDTNNFTTATRAYAESSINFAKTLSENKKHWRTNEYDVIEFSNDNALRKCSAALGDLQRSSRQLQSYAQNLMTAKRTLRSQQLHSHEQP